MKFYLEYPDRESRDAGTNSDGNVLAVDEETFWSGGKKMHEALGAVFFWPNSPVASTGVSEDVLEQRCAEITEEAARVIHPRLFERIDS